MKYGYARVSSKDQNLDRQVEKLKTVPVKCIFMEKVSGVEQDRPELAALMDVIVRGDEVVVLSLDRLSRDTEQLTQLMLEFSVKGAKLTVLDMPRFDEITNVNTRNFIENVVVSMKTYLAAEERVQIKERQRQGIELAKKRGVFRGGQKLYTADSKDPERRQKYFQIKQLLSEHYSVPQIMKIVGCSNTLIYRIKGEL
jgi:DNA invertase Pin-like site-specific DNA recombinase